MPSQNYIAGNFCRSVELLSFIFAYDIDTYFIVSCKICFSRNDGIISESKSKR